MGANLYGVANPLILPQYFSPPAGPLITIPGNAETVFVTSPTMATISQGFFYPMVWGYVAIQFGVGILGPSAFTWRIGAGSDLNIISFNQNTFLANGTCVYPINFTGIASNSVWKPPGNVLNIGIQLSTAQGCQVNPVGSWFICT